MSRFWLVCLCSDLSLFRAVNNNESQTFMYYPSPKQYFLSSCLLTQVPDLANKMKRRAFDWKLWGDFFSILFMPRVKSKSIPRPPCTTLSIRPVYPLKCLLWLTGLGMEPLIESFARINLFQEVKVAEWSNVLTCRWFEMLTSGMNLLQNCGWFTWKRRMLWFVHKEFRCCVMHIKYLFNGHSCIHKQKEG